MKLPDERSEDVGKHWNLSNTTDTLMFATMRKQSILDSGIYQWYS